MGFMAGFGPAFANSFRDARDRSAKRKDDLFKLTYQEFLSRRSKKEEADKKNSEAIRYAKSLIQGREDIPEEAWSVVAQWKLNGLSDAQIEDNLERGEWTVNSNLKPKLPTMAESMGLAGIGSVGGRSAMEAYLDAMIGVESAGKADAKNPKSTATGVAQFIEPTWALTVAKHAPHVVNNMTYAQVMALKTTNPTAYKAIMDMRLDPTFSRQMAKAFTEDNHKALEKAGVAVTPATSYLSHFLGVDDAIDVAKADPTDTLADVLGTSKANNIAAANPGISASKTASQMMGWAESKMSKALDAPGITATTPMGAAGRQSTPAGPIPEDQRLQGEAIATGNPVTLTQGTEERGGILSGLFGRDRDNRSRLDRARDRSFDQIAQITGTSRDEIEGIMSFDDSKLPELPDTTGVTFTKKAKPVDFVSHAESIYRYNLAVQNGDQGQANHYKSMIKSHEFAKDYDAAVESGAAGGMVAYQLRDGTWKTGVLTQDGGKVLNPQGQEVDVIRTRPISEEEFKIHSELREKNPEVVKYRARQIDAANLMAAAKELDEIATLRPMVLTRTGGIVGSLREIYNDIIAAGDLMTRLTKENKTSEQITKELKNAGIIHDNEDASSLENRVTEMLRKGEFANEAEAKALFDTKVKLMTYRIGRLEGQEGRGMSDKDFKRLQDVIRNANGDLDTFRAGLNSYVKQMIDGLDAEAISLNDYNATVDYLIDNFGVSPVDKIVPGTRAFIEQTGNEAYIEAFEHFSSQEALTAAEHVEKNISSEQEAAQASAPEGYKAIGKTPDGKGIVYQDKDGNLKVRWIK